MGRRIDWFDDPDAPPPNSLVPAASVIVVDADGQVLMIRRTDSGNYSLPGGVMELGESIAEAAIREAKEETGFDVAITGVIGIYSDPGHLIEYTSDGEVRQEFTTVFSAHLVGGKATLSSESSEVTWIDPKAIERVPMTESVRQRLRHHLAGGQAPFIG